MDAVEAIVLSTMVALVGVVVGAKVQRMARFIYPTDVFTITAVAWVLADTAFSVSGLNPFWYLPFLLGYVVGYLIVGRTSYIMVWETELGDKRVTMRPWVVWCEGGCTYLQIQSNRALLRRLVFGVRHDIVSTGPLDADWQVVSKYPLFPVFDRPAVVAENVSTTFELVHAFWRFKVRHYVTEMAIAYGSVVSKIQLAQDEQALTSMQRLNNDLTSEVHELRARQGPMLMQMALDLLQKIDKTKPVNCAYDLVRQYEASGRGKRQTEEDLGYGDKEDCADPSQ